jgi:hypothetical protein
VKSTNVFLSIILAIAFTLPMFGQDAKSTKTKTHMKKHDMSHMMGKPTAVATVEGLHMKVWLMTQKQHKKMMKGKMGQMMMGDKKGMEHDGMGMKDSSMGMGKDMMGMKHHDMEMKDTSMAMNHDGMDKATMEAMMAGTHCIMLEVTDAATGKKISDASVKVMNVSPSKKHSSVDLIPMMKHFGSGLALDEKGKYEFTVNVTVGGVVKTMPFKYVVK